MKKKILVLLLTLVMVFAMAVPTYAAQTVGGLKEDLSDVQSEQDEVKNQLSDVKDQIESLDKKVSALNSEISAAAQKIADTEAKIEKKQNDMQEREDGLNQRLRVMYKNGSVGFIDVLLGSNSISEFISNMDMLQRIYENDVDVLETLKREAEELKEIKKGLEAEKQSLAAKQAELKKDQSELDSLKSKLEAREDELNEEAQRLTAEIRRLTSSSSEYVGGIFVWPAPASHYLTSPFGWRNHPVYHEWRYHSGIDIGAGYGTNVLAAASGTVIMSRNYGSYSYGQCLMIDHGGGIVTLYGHLSSRLVSQGQTVTAGQVIGKVGSTGVSTGPHLHFEVRKNGECVEPMDYVS